MRSQPNHITMKVFTKVVEVLKGFTNQDVIVYVVMGKTRYSKLVHEDEAPNVGDRVVFEGFYRA